MNIIVLLSYLPTPAGKDLRGSAVG